MKRVYQSLFSLSWSSNFIYRLNFVMWRFRAVFQILVVYFIWQAILSSQPGAFEYTRSELLTYVIGISLIRSLVFSSKSFQIQNEISSGDLNNHLTKPINYFKYWFTQDLADKALNLIFSIGELFIIFLLLKPPLVGPATLLHGIFFIIATTLAMILYFYFSLLISLTTFWLPEGNGWPQRFFFFVLLEFLAGGWFPLDLLPQYLYLIASKLPTAFMLSIPLQIYLGRLTIGASIASTLAAFTWTIILMQISQRVFARGLKIYGAYGR